MLTKQPSRMSPTISDEAVQAKTGKTWPEWFALLDKAHAKTMSHQEIVAYLVERHQVGPWWQQMITVTYEQMRGLREKHERPGGFEISVSKTVSVPVDELFLAWKNKSTRVRWLPDPAIVIRKATPNKSIRLTWLDGKSSVDVNFYPKSESKSQVVVQHGKLADAKEAARQKAYWSKTMARLKAWLEK
jgi:uncharacterized protein YndB with AHSA1/START domain